MPWLRVSDTAAHDPRVVAVLDHPDADERTADELFGYVLRLATLSAQHATDYCVAYATALAVAGTRSRTDRLLTLAEFAGYGALEVDADTGRRRFRLVDEVEFIHMKTAEEIAWEKQRRDDVAQPQITVPVRHRDGDACRYCGKVVNWSDRKGGIGGTYDHRPPGMPASADTMVVACRSCNSERGIRGRGLDPQAALAAADAVLPLWGIPTVPYYKPATRTWLSSNAEVLAPLGLTPPPPATSKRVVRSGEPAPGTVGPPPVATPGSADPAPDGVRPAAPQAPAAEPRRENGSNPSAVPADRQGDGSGYAGSGRVGSGRGGSGRAGTEDPPAPAPPPRRRRGRRGGGRRPSSSQSQGGQTR